MALGGGTFTSQNKILPGSYINFVSAERASSELSERGYFAVPYVGDWGASGEVVGLSSAMFLKNCLAIFGYDYTSPQMKPFREIYRNAVYGYFYRLNGGGTQASNTYATAKYNGVHGNLLKTVIQANVDDPTLFDVDTYLDNTLVDEQTVATSADLKNNNFVTWKTGATLAVTAGILFTGGISDSETDGDYSNFLNLIEGYNYNALICPSDEDTVKGLFAAFTHRLRDEQGVKFQAVVSNYTGDYEGVVNVKNLTVDGGIEAVYWVGGVVAGTPANRSALNKIYDGEYSFNVNYTQKQLEDAIKNGEFTFHRVHDTVRVLSDINSLTTTTDEKGDIFKDNQTIRVIDQIANDIAVMFNDKYLGIIPNDRSGRLSLWSDIVSHHEQLQQIRAIENFTGENVTVEQGETRRSVVITDAVTIVNAMAQLYMTVTVD